MSKQSSKQKSDPSPVVARSRNKPVPGKPPVEPTTIWAIAIFAAVVLIFFWSHLFGKAFLWEDFTEFTFPNQVFAARSFSAGTTPFWNPYTFNGMPFVADLQNGYFYPPNVFMYIISGGNLSAQLAQVFVVLHYLLAMIGAWKLARTLKIGQWGSIMSGISYGLGGMMVAQMIHSNMVFHLAWFPLIVAWFYRGVKERSLLHAALSGLTLGIALLSGHPQSALFIVFFLFCMTVWLLVSDFRSKDPERKKGIVTALVAAALPVIAGAGIFAIQLLPSQELAGLSERAEMTYEKSTEGSLAMKQVLTLVVPKLFGTATGDRMKPMTFWLRPENYYFWETVVYIGVVTLLLMCVGVVSKRLGSLRWFFAGMGVLGLLYALGDSFFVHPILAKLPLFNTFRIPTRMAMYLSLGGSILAGVGLERIIGMEKDAKDNAMKVVYIVGGVIAAIGLLTVTGALASSLGAPAEVAGKVSTSGIIPFLIGGLTIAVSWAGMNQKMPNLGVAVAILLFCLVDLFAFGIDQNASPEDPGAIYKSNDAQFVSLKADPPKNIFRVSMREGGSMLMQRNQGPFSGIMLYEGYNPLLLSRRVPPAPTQDIAFDLLDMRYALQIDSVRQSVGLAERKSAYPHARMLYNATLMDDKEKVKELMKGGTVDFAKTVLLEHPPGSSTNSAIAFDGSGTGTATITKYSPAEIVVDVNTDKQGALVLSEIWYPAWNAYIDDKPTELLIANYSQRAVVVPPGKHTVTMRFESEAFSKGRLITFASLFVTGALVVVFWFRRKKQAEM